MENDSERFFVIFEGVLVGGFISDRFVLKSGPHGRIWVLIASQILAAPFAAGALLLPTPYAYMSLIPTYIIGNLCSSKILYICTLNNGLLS